MKTKLLFNRNHPTERSFKINSINALPRVGDTVIDTDLTYIVKEVIFNYDNDEICVILKRPDEE